MPETEWLLSRAFMEAHPADSARILEGLPAEEAVTLLEEITPRTAASLLRRMVPGAGAECLPRLSPQRAGAIIAAMPMDAAAGLLRRLPSEAQERLLASAPRTVAALRLLLQYPSLTAGALMDPRVLALPDDITIGESRSRVRRSPRHVLYYLYVVDRAHALVGVLNLRELMLASSKAPLASVMHREISRLSATSDRVAIVAHPGWRDFHALPVVDERGTFVGAIRYETIRQLEEGAEGPPRQRDPLGILLMLGELYWVGLAGMLRGLTSHVGSPRAADGSEAEADHGA